MCSMSSWQWRHRRHFFKRLKTYLDKKDFQVTMASKGLIFSRVGNELENFVDSLKYLHNRIRVKFFLKMRDYGDKLVIDATDEISEKTFFNILVKIWSVEEIEAFKLLLEGMRTSIEKKCQCNDSSDTHNSVWWSISCSQINCTGISVRATRGLRAARMLFLSAGCTGMLLAYISCLLWYSSSHWWTIWIISFEVI